MRDKRAFSVSALMLNDGYNTQWMRRGKGKRKERKRRKRRRKSRGGRRRSRKGKKGKGTLATNWSISSTPARERMRLTQRHEPSTYSPDSTSSMARIRMPPYASYRTERRRQEKDGRRKRRRYRER